METSELFAGLQNLVLGEQPITKEATGEGEEQKTEPIGFTLDELSQPDSVEPKTKEETEEDLIKEIKTKGKQEETTTEVTDNKKPETEEVVDGDTSEVYKAISGLLKEEGIVETEFTSAEEMFGAIGKIVENEVKEYKETLPPVIKELLNNYEDGVPLEDLVNLKSEQIRFDSITDDQIEENESLAKDILINHYKSTTRYSDDKIKKEIKRLEDLGELVDEAKSAKVEMVQLYKEHEEKLKEETKKRQIAEKAENEKVVKEIHKTITSTKEIIPGIKVNDKEAEQIFKMVTTPVEIRGNQPISAAMKVREADPVKFDMTLNYLISKGAFEGKWDDLFKKAETKTASKLEKQVEEAAAKLINKGGNPSGLNLSNKTIDALKNMKRS